MDTAELMKKAVNCEMIEMKSPHVHFDDGSVVPIDIY